MIQELWLGDLKVHDANAPYSLPYALNETDLLSGPEPRALSQPRPRSHGSTNRTRHWNARQISLVGWCSDESPALTEAALDALKRTLRLTGEPIVMRFRRTGLSYYERCLVVPAGKLDAPRKGWQPIVKWGVPLEAPDPRLYADAESSAAYFPMPQPDPLTALLIHADGDPASQVFTDASMYGHAITPVGNAQVGAAWKKFGTGALLLDGSSYLSTPDAADLHVGAQAFTADFWVRLDSVAVDQAFIGQWNSAGSGRSWRFSYRAGVGLRFLSSADGAAVVDDVQRTWTPVVGQEYHLAVVRAGGVLKMFVDGVQVGVDATVGTTFFDSSQPVTVGGNPTNENLLIGRMDEVRLSIGVARWLANFAPPTAPYNPNPGSGAGLRFPLRFPLEFGGSGAAALLVNNAGSEETPPTFTIMGPLDPATAIDNETTDRSIYFDGLSIPTGVQAVVDVAGRALRLDGVDRPDLIDGRLTDWFELVPGDNQLRLRGGAMAGDSTALAVTFRDART